MALRNGIRVRLGLPKIKVSGNKAELAGRLQADETDYLQAIPDNAPVELLVPLGPSLWAESTVAVMKDEIRRRNLQRQSTGATLLPLGGKKADLVQRLTEDDASIIRTET